MKTQSNLNDKLEQRHEPNTGVFVTVCVTVYGGNHSDTHHNKNLHGMPDHYIAACLKLERPICQVNVIMCENLI